MNFDVQGRVAYAYTGGKPWADAPRCVVFVHGALNDHSVWTLLARWYAHHGYAVLAVDQPGHGRSDGPPLASIEASADWILALLDAAGVQSACLVGHSMGSLIALETAARAPDRADRLVMIATAYPMKVSAALLDTARDDPPRAIAMVNAFSHAGIASKPSYPGPGAWLHGASSALMHRIQHGGAGAGNLFEHDFRVCDAYARGLEAAAAVRCPAHLILGDRDLMTPPKATLQLIETMRAGVTHVRAGHALMQEAPEAMLNAMRQAILRLSMRPALETEGTTMANAVIRWRPQVAAQLRRVLPVLSRRTPQRDLPSPALRGLHAVAAVPVGAHLDAPARLHRRRVAVRLRVRLDRAFRVREESPGVLQASALQPDG